MRLTTKGRYAVTAMLDLALHSSQGPVSLADISLRQGISQSYLEQLFGKMKRAKLVNSLRGPGGGYRLGRAITDITVSTIVASVGEGVDATRCGGTGDCQEGAVCLTHELWSELSNQIDAFLDEITLAALVSRQDVLLVSARQDAATNTINPAQDNPSSQLISTRAVI